MFHTSQSSPQEEEKKQIMTKQKLSVQPVVTATAVIPAHAGCIWGQAATPPSFSWQWKSFSSENHCCGLKKKNTKKNPKPVVIPQRSRSVTPCPGLSPVLSSYQLQQADDLLSDKPWKTRYQLSLISRPEFLWADKNHFPLWCHRWQQLQLSQLAHSPVAPVPGSDALVPSLLQRGDIREATK